MTQIESGWICSSCMGTAVSPIGEVTEWCDKWSADRDCDTFKPDYRTIVSVRITSRNEVLSGLWEKRLLSRLLSTYKEYRRGRI